MKENDALSTHVATLRRIYCGPHRFLETLSVYRVEFSTACMVVFLRCPRIILGQDDAIATAI